VSSSLRPRLDKKFNVRRISAAGPDLHSQLMRMASLDQPFAADSFGGFLSGRRPLGQLPRRAEATGKTGSPVFDESKERQISPNEEVTLIRLVEKMEPRERPPAPPPNNGRGT